MSTYNAEKITTAILEAISTDMPSWRKPWRDMRAQGLSTYPVNAITGKMYRGINFFILLSRMDCDMRYVTYNQAKQLGGNVKRGEKGTQIVFWKPTKYEKTNKATGETELAKGLILKLYTVFNVSQCENMDKLKGQLPQPVVPFSMTQIYDALNANVQHGGDNACYIPSVDQIHMPRPEAFTSEDSYKAVAFHELTHWTGAKHRLDRELSRFGRHAYAAEELVAELGSAFLCASFGINSSLEHHASYIKHWNEMLKSDPSAVITAAGKAQAAVDYILDGIMGKNSAESDDVESEDSAPMELAA